MAEPPGESRADQVDQAQDDAHRDGPPPAPQLGVGQDHAGLVAGLVAGAVLERASIREALAVANGRPGAELHRCPGDVDPPAQVDVLSEEGDLGAEPVDRGEQVRAHEHACGRHREDVTGAVVLGLVELTRVDQRHRAAEDVDGEADRSQHVLIVPVDELGTDHAGVGPERLGDHRGHRVGTQADVVVHEQQERGSLDRHQGLVGRGREPPVLGESTDEGGRQHVGHPGGGVVDGPVVDDEQGEVLVVLVRDGREALLEPVPRIAGDHDRDDRRRSGAHDRGVVGQPPLGVLGRVVGVILGVVGIGLGHPVDIGAIVGTVVSAVIVSAVIVSAVVDVAHAWRPLVLDGARPGLHQPSIARHRSRGGHVRARLREVIGLALAGISVGVTGSRRWSGGDRPGLSEAGARIDAHRARWTQRRGWDGRRS